MIVTRLNNGRLIFSAENWKEMFRIRVANHLFRMNKDIRLPRGYIRVKECERKNIMSWFWPLKLRLKSNNRQ